MIRGVFWLTDDLVARLEPFLPGDTWGKPRVEDRRVISGIVHLLNSGGRSIDAPSEYGPRKTRDNRFARWANERRPGRSFSCAGVGGRPSGRGPDR
jgi:transposase